MPSGWFGGDTGGGGGGGGYVPPALLAARDAYGVSLLRVGGGAPAPKKRGWNARPQQALQRERELREPPNAALLWSAAPRRSGPSHVVGIWICPGAGRGVLCLCFFQPVHKNIHKIYKCAVKNQKDSTKQVFFQEVERFLFTRQNRICFRRTLPRGAQSARHTRVVGGAAVRRAARGGGGAGRGGRRDAREAPRVQPRLDY
jgi:hypothetical protein